MAPRSSLVAAAALVVALGAAGPSIPAPAGTGALAPFAPPIPARAVSEEVVFAPDPSPVPARTAAPARRSGLIFTVAGRAGDPAPAPAEEEGEGEDLPAIPVPEGWAPAPVVDTDALLGLEGAFRPMAAEDGPVLGDPCEFAADEEGPVFEEAACDPCPPDPCDDEEPAAVEIVRYEESVDVGTEVVVIGTPVLVIERTTCVAYGPFRAVRCAPAFDPCFTPPRGACWEPIAYDTTWNPCCDPRYGSWEAFDKACCEPAPRGGGGHVGLVVVEDDPRPEPRPAPRPVRDRVVAAPPVRRGSLGAPAAEEGPAMAGVAVGAGVGDRSGAGTSAPRLWAAIPRAPRTRAPASPAPPPALPHETVHHPAPVATPASDTPSLMTGAGTTGRRSGGGHRASPPPETREESALVASDPEPRSAAPARRERAERPERPAPRARSRDHDEDGDAGNGGAASAGAPAPRNEPRAGRSREEAPEARAPERARPAPASPPPETPQGHGGGRGGHERAAEHAAPPPPPPPPPAPPSDRHHR